MNAPKPKLTLQVGGQLNPRKHLFVSRQDLEDELLEALVQREYCNLLSSRQVGKSSVMMQTAVRLQQRGIRVATIDVAGELGTPATAAEWYQGFLGKIARDLRIELDVAAWWERQPGTPNQRLLEFCRTQLFASHDSPLVIFVDEIDATLKLPYTDDFFTAIRTMYNQRGSEPAFEKIAFCLIGVATPNELVKDRRTTTYNVGRTFEVRDFDPQRDDLSPLAALLADDPPAAEKLLQHVLDWTGGHPFLTLWVCQEVRKRKLASPEEVDTLIRESFASFSRVQSDPHFQQITRFLGERLSDQLAAYRLYDRILQGQTERDTAGRTHIELKLSGIVKRDENGNLAVRNRIYGQVFDRQWVRQSKPQQTLRRVRQAATAATLLLVLSGTWFGYDRLVQDPVRQNRIVAEGLVDSLQLAEIVQVPGLIERMKGYRQWTDPLLQNDLKSDDPKRRLRASLAMLAADSGDTQIDYLWPQLLTDTSEDGPVIAQVLEQYAADEPRSLTARTVVGDAQRFRRLFPRLAQHSARSAQTVREAVGILSQEIAKANGAASAVLHPRRAVACIAALSLGDMEAARPLLELGPHPDTRSYVIHLLADYAPDPQPLVEFVQVADLPPAVRSALLLGLGHLPAEKIPADAVALTQRIFENEQDAGLHAAAFWALRQWKAAVPELTPSAKTPADRDWYVNSIGMTLVRIPAGTFWMGSESESASNGEKLRHEVTLTKDFFLSACEVTVAQFLQFYNDPDLPADEKPVAWLEEWNRDGKQYSPTDDCPIQSVSWQDAVRFCNWLSRREKRTEVYVQTGETRNVKDVLDKEVETEVWTSNLQTDGYRLPTEAQWEYACRGESETEFEFGDAIELLNNYAFYRENSADKAWPVASKLPNPWGLSDMQGNVWEWCQDWYTEDAYKQSEAKDPSGPSTGEARVFRGGGWYDDGEYCRPAIRYRSTPEGRYGDLGFRVAPGWSSE